MAGSSTPRDFPTQIYAVEVDPSPAGARINRVRQNPPPTGPLFPPALAQQILAGK